MVYNVMTEIIESVLQHALSEDTYDSEPGDLVLFESGSSSTQGTNKHSGHHDIGCNRADGHCHLESLCSRELRFSSCPHRQADADLPWLFVLWRTPSKSG